MNTSQRTLSRCLPVLLCIIVSCAGGHADHSGAPALQALKSSQLAAIEDRAEGMPFLKSLLIVQDGEMIVERYLHGGGANQCIDIKSASKSILSAILGIAIHEGYIEGLDQRVMDFFPRYTTADLDPRVFTLTLRHLVTMTSGFGIQETPEAYRRLFASTNWIDHILRLPITSQPGDRFNYLSVNTHLLSAIVTHATGMSTRLYARKVLFGPLSIDDIYWDRDPQGYCIGGWGLSLRARDMAKIGQLYLNAGRLGDRQVVPLSWIRQSTVQRTGMLSTYYSRGDNTYGYGYLWWLKRIDGNPPIPFALGHGGQRIAILSTAKAVIVTQADPTVDPSRSHQHHRAVDKLIFNDLAQWLIGWQGEKGNES